MTDLPRSGPAAAGTPPTTGMPGTSRSARADEIVAAARRVLEREGPEALTMRRLGHEVGIRAPSLYKHFPDKAAVEAALVADALVEVGELLHDAVAHPGPDGAVAGLLTAYRRYALAHPHLYRLATVGPLARERLPAGHEDRAGEPFFLVTGEPYRAQALWSLAHGMAILEIDGRYPADSQLDRTWRAGAAAFAPVPAEAAPTTNT